jgi:flagellar hook-associated protein 3 FlgL
MRINPNQTPDLLAALANTQSQQNTSILQLSTGRRVNKPSDDPAAAAQVVINHDLSNRADSFQQSMGSIQGQLQIADSTLSSVVNLLTRAITLGIQGGNSATLSDADRNAIADELRALQSQLINLGNASYQGRYIFSGTDQASAPFVLDNTVPSGVRYSGNAGVNTVSIGPGYQLQINLPGDQLLASPAAGAFQSLHDLINAVISNNGVDAAVNAVRESFDFVTSQRVFFGNGLNQIEAQQSLLATQKTQLSAQENTIAGADVAAAASRVTNTETALNATFAAIGRVAQSTLFDFLR